MTGSAVALRESGKSVVVVVVVVVVVEVGVGWWWGAVPAPSGVVG